MGSSTWDEDGLHAHPRVLLAGVEAMGLWTLARSYCRTYQTGGLITPLQVAHQVRDAAQAERCTAALLAAGLWDTTDKGYLFHDWHAMTAAKAAPPATTAQTTLAGIEPPPSKRLRRPLPFTPLEALQALAAGGGSRVVVGAVEGWSGGHVIALQKQIKKFPDLAVWTRVGAWLAAGGRARMGMLGIAWAASADFCDAAVMADAWHTAGRGPVGPLAGLPGGKPWSPPVAAHVPGSVRDYAADDGGDDTFTHPARRAAHA